MSSYSTADGAMALTITFKLGTDLDKAQVLVQNRVAIATPRLPEEVRTLGVTTLKSSPDLMMVVHMLSPDDSYDQLYVSNYARNNVRDVLLRLDGVGDLIIFGERQYSLRIWLDPDKLAAFGMTSGDVVRAVQEQNVQVSGGSLGAEPAPRDNAFQLIVKTQGRFDDPRQFRQIIVRATRTADWCALQDVARVELGAQDYVTNSYLNGKPAVALAIFQRPGTNALGSADEIIAHDGRAEADFPPGLDYQIVYNPTEFIADSRQRRLQDAVRGDVPCRPRRPRLPADLAHGDHPDRRDPGLADRHLRGHGGPRLLAQHADAVRHGARHRHRRRRCHRGGRERRAQHRPRPVAARGGPRTMDEVGTAVIAIALVLVAVFIPTAFIPGISRPVLPPVRPDHRGVDPHLRLQFADAVARARRAPPEAAQSRRPPQSVVARLGSRMASRFNRGFDATSRSLCTGPSAASCGTSSSFWPIYAGLIAGTVWIAQCRSARLHPDPRPGLCHRRRSSCPTARPCRGRMLSSSAPRRSCRRRRASRMRWPSRAFPAPPSPTPSNAAAIFARFKPIRRAGGGWAHRRRDHRRALRPAAADRGGLHHRHPAAAGARPRQFGRLQDAAAGAHGRRRRAVLAAAYELMGRAPTTPNLAGVFTTFTANARRSIWRSTARRPASSMCRSRNIFETLQSISEPPM